MAAALLCAQRMLALAACLSPDTAAISVQDIEAVPSDALDVAQCGDTAQEITSLKHLAEEKERVVSTVMDQRSGGGRSLLQTSLCTRQRRCEAEIRMCVPRRKQQRPGIAKNDKNNGTIKTTNKPTQPQRGLCGSMLIRFSTV